jgi:hypothetical protein
MMPFAAPMVSMMLARSSVASLCPRSPRAITALIDRMLSADPLARPSMSEVRTTLTRIIVGDPMPRRTVETYDDEVTRFDIAALAG